MRKEETPCTQVIGKLGKESVIDPSRRDFLKSVGLATNGIVLGSILTCPKETWRLTGKLYLHKVPMDERRAITFSAFVNAQFVLRRRMLEDMGQEKMNTAINQSGLIVGKNDKKIFDRF
jgi:hypothetical protein